MKRALFVVLMLAIPLAFLLIIVAIFFPRLEARVRPALVAYMASRVTPAERDSIYQRIGLGGSFWESTADPDVGSLGQPNRTIIDSEVEVHLNNAGMRASRNYGPKKPGTFRIVCLGDSFVFGMGGPESDRFCDQMEAFYREHHIQANGQPIEMYAVGLPGWTAVQEATYLASRITSYDPDLIILLAVANDIGDNFGVSGVGALTRRFSPESRSLGSAVFSDELNRFFGDDGDRSAVAWDMSPTSRARWDKAIGRLRRLAETQTRRGKLILTSVMTWGPTGKRDYFSSEYQTRFQQQAVPGPLQIVSFLPGPRTMLTHDSHPNQFGHRLLRDQYLNALHRLGWVTLPDSVLPKLNPETPLRLNPSPDRAPYQAFTRQSADVVGQEIDFTKLPAPVTRAFVGGVLPESQDPAHARDSAPWGTLNTTFLLRRPAGRPLSEVEVDFEIPPYPELFPFTLRLSLDGAPAASVQFDHPSATGRYRIAGAPKAAPFNDAVVEIVLETSSYFSTIDDPRMRSYRLLRARAS